MNKKFIWIAVAIYGGATVLALLTVVQPLNSSAARAKSTWVKPSHQSTGGSRSNGAARSVF